MTTKSNSTALERAMARTKGMYEPNEGVSSMMDSLEGVNQARLLQSKAPPKDYSGRTPEGKVKGEIRKALDEVGMYYFMPATGGYGRSGVWDFCLCINGVHVQIEAKESGTSPLTVAQWDNGLALWRESGIGAVLWDEATAYQATHDIIRLVTDTSRVDTRRLLLTLKSYTWKARLVNGLTEHNLFYPENESIARRTIDKV